VIGEKPARVKTQEGIELCRVLTHSIGSTDRKLDQSPEGGHRELVQLASVGCRQTMGNDKRARIGDESSRLVFEGNP
jgi:hypothetical protein